MHRTPFLQHSHGVLRGRAELHTERTSLAEKQAATAARMEAIREQAAAAKQTSAAELAEVREARRRSRAAPGWSTVSTD